MSHAAHVRLIPVLLLSLAGAHDVPASQLVELYFTEVHYETEGRVTRQAIRISLRDDGHDGFTLETVRNWNASLAARMANEAAGSFGEEARYSLGNRALVTRSGERYTVTNYIQNFRLIAVLTPGASSCQADVSYPLNPHETLYVMFSRGNKVRHTFTRLAAEDVRCSIKALGES